MHASEATKEAQMAEEQKKRSGLFFMLSTDIQSSSTDRKGRFVGVRKWSFQGTLRGL
jgi:hypothetical protein